MEVKEETKQEIKPEQDTGTENPASDIEPGETNWRWLINGFTGKCICTFFFINHVPFIVGDQVSGNNDKILAFKGKEKGFQN